MYLFLSFKNATSAFILLCGSCICGLILHHFKWHLVQPWHRCSHLWIRQAVYCLAVGNVTIGVPSMLCVQLIANIKLPAAGIHLHLETTSSRCFLFILFHFIVGYKFILCFSSLQHLQCWLMCPYYSSMLKSWMLDLTWTGALWTKL